MSLKQLQNVILGWYHNLLCLHDTYKQAKPEKILKKLKEIK